MPPKFRPFEFYETTLKKAQHVVAPMVDASELAWRMLGRRYGADLCYTPMLHSGVFVRDGNYRRDNLQSCPEDRPLILQFCSNDPETFKKAVQLALGLMEFDAVDLNLGCPQVIAKRGHFGSYLQDEWDLLHRMVSAIHDNFNVPVTCKIRVFEDIQKTVDYAKMLESAGCQLLTVHGRTRDQKGPLTGVASWRHIGAVVKAVKIPVIANGNVQCFADIERCLTATGAHGVMSAEGHLTNPAIFSAQHQEEPPTVWDMTLEYLELVDLYPCPVSYSRGHVFKLLHMVLRDPANFDVREDIGKAQDMAAFKKAALAIKERYLAKHLKWQDSKRLDDGLRSLPPWLCQPYVRMAPEEHVQRMQEISQRDRLLRETVSTTEEPPGDETEEIAAAKLSKKKLKLLQKNPRKKFGGDRELLKLCPNPKGCLNPLSLKCDFGLCRQCCLKKCTEQESVCPGHRIFSKTKRGTQARNLTDTGPKESSTNSIAIITVDNGFDVPVATEATS